MVSISYCITTHNEGEVYIRPLLENLLSVIQPEDEIVVVDDCSDEPSTLMALSKYEDRINLFQHKFEGDFAEHKNFAKSKCTKEYIFFIDADENVNKNLLLTLKEILYNNPSVDLYLVPRVNVVTGLTPDHVQKWGWRINEKGFINYPDLQTRIIKNKPEIVWEGKVHERLVGHDTHTALPHQTEDYCLLHIKDIKRQEKQNSLYDTL
jgi:glycosyltransferase involved in cell wall biosynthesis